MDKLYGLVFEFRKTKLWNKLEESDIFAVKFDNGKIGYIAVEGRVTGQPGLTVYLGEDGFYNLQNKYFHRESISRYEAFYANAISDELLVTFYDGAYIDKEKLEKMREFKRDNNIRLSGKNIFPEFHKSSSFRLITDLETARERDYLRQSLEASIELAKILKDISPRKIGLGYFFDLDEIPLIERINGKFEINGKKELPWDYEIDFPSAFKFAQDSLNFLRKLKHRKKCQKVINCEIAIANSIVPFGKYFYYPQLLIAIEDKTGVALQSHIVPNYEDDPDDFVNNFLLNLVISKIFPYKINVADKRTFDLLKNLRGALGIEIEIVDKLNHVDDFREGLMEVFNSPKSEDEIDLVQLILDADDEDVEKFDKDIIIKLKEIINLDLIDEFTKEALREKLSINKYF